MTTMQPQDWDKYDDAESNVNLEAIPVHIIRDSSEIDIAAADFGGYATFTIPVWTPGVQVQATQILPRRPKRYRAIVVAGTLSSQTIILNSRVDSLNSADPQGYTLVASQQTLEIKNKEPLYAIATGTPCTLSILDEGWR
jgi:hypothetical protein